MNDEVLHQVTIRCPEKAGSLVHELRARAGDHIRGDVRMTTSGTDRIIELLVDDVEPVRRTVDDAAPEGTCLHVGIPSQRGHRSTVD